MKTNTLFVWLFLFLLSLISFAQNPTGTAIAPIPNLSYSDGEGFEYGGKIFLYHFGDGKRQPYRWCLALSGARTTRDKTDLGLFADLPHFFGFGSRMDFNLEYKDLQLEDYCGLGNDNSYNASYVKKNDPQFKALEYYSYKRRTLSFTANAQFPLFHPYMRALAGFGFFQTHVASYSEPNVFSSNKPFGAKGGQTNYIRFGLIIDSRDQEAVPHRGIWTDALIEPVLKILDSDYQFTRFTFTHRYYLPLQRKIVFAHRLLYEKISGSPPFNQMAVISSSYQRQEGLGGSKSLRGVPRLLYIGPDKFLSNLEIRWQFTETTILKQHLTWYWHIFCDAGRVWLHDDPFTLTNLHFSEGIGLHVLWKKNFIGALDIGRSPQLDYAIYINFGGLF